MWRRDRETSEYGQILAEVRRETGVADLELSFSWIEKRSPDVAHLLYSSIRAGLAAGGANGRSPLLDVAVLVLGHLVAAGDPARTLSDATAKIGAIRDGIGRKRSPDPGTGSAKAVVR